MFCFKSPDGRDSDAHRPWAYIPKVIQNALFGLLLFAPTRFKKTRNRVDYYSSFKIAQTQKSNRPKQRISKDLGYSLLSIMLLLLLPMMVHASNASIGPIQFDEQNISPALKAFALLTILSLAPSILMMLTSFTRIVVVLSMLRTALGLQQTPPNSILISLALFLTLLTMMPVAKTIYTQAYEPYEAHKIDIQTALNKGVEPLKQYMIKQTREKDLQVILELAKDPVPASIQDVKLYQLIPAFLLSELQSAFQIGFMIFLPFLLIDLIVSGILMTMGMMMLPPMSISLPVKLLLFVLIDGWDLTVQALVGSIY